MGVKFRNTIDLIKAKAYMMGIGQGTVRLATEYLAERARMYVPIDTGFLQSSIIVSASPSGLTSMVQVAAFYAQFVEFGHTTRGGGFKAPNPFFRKALDDTRREFPSFVQDAKLNVPMGDMSGNYNGFQITSHGVHLGATLTE